MNEVVLWKVKAAILLQPDHYEQNCWDCKTAACIAGWTGRLTGQPLPSLVCLDESKRKEVQAVHKEARSRVQKTLKLDDDQWTRLTNINYWPVEFRNKDFRTGEPGVGVKGKTPKERADTAGRRIDRFLETNGRE